MAATTKTIRRAIASLKLSPNKVSALVTYCQGIVKVMTGNPAFPSSTAALAAITTAINGLQTAETAALARTKGAVAVRNEKRAALRTSYAVEAERIRARRTRPPGRGRVPESS